MGTFGPDRKNEDDKANFNSANEYLDFCEFLENELGISEYKELRRKFQNEYYGESLSCNENSDLEKESVENESDDSIRIYLSEYLNGSVYYGRMNGLSLRKTLDLSQRDDEAETVTFVVPSGVESINPSFYLGFLKDSIENLGIERFDGKYKFEFEDDNKQTLDILKNNLRDGKKYSILELNDWDYGVLKNNFYE